MAFDLQLAQRIREYLAQVSGVEEKEMMGGLSFMFNHKMCVGIIKDEMMCRIDPNLYEESLKKAGCRPMDFTGKPMKGWVMIAPEALQRMEDLAYWIELALAYNAKAPVSKKKKPKG